MVDDRLISVDASLNNGEVRMRAVRVPQLCVIQVLRLPNLEVPIRRPALGSYKRMSNFERI